MKLAAIAKLIKADGYCKLYKVFYDDCRTYVYLPDGTLLDKGRADKVSSFAHNDRIVKVTIDGKTYETSWANVVLVEE